MRQLRTLARTRGIAAREYARGGPLKGLQRSGYGQTVPKEVLGLELVWWLAARRAWRGRKEGGLVASGGQYMGIRVRMNGKGPALRRIGTGAGMGLRLLVFVLGGSRK